jgi:rubrerythrin
MDNELLNDKATLLRHAIKGEEEGYNFYHLLAQQAVNREAKKRLEILRDDENRHKAILTNLFHKHVGPDLGNLPEKGGGPLAQVFDKGKLKIFKSEVEYINIGIEAELATIKFYKAGMDIVGDKDFANILYQLAEEENGHYEILMAEREALAGNYYWFASDSSAPMED